MTKVNFTLVASSERQSGVTSRLTQEVYRLLSQPNDRVVLVLSSTEHNALLQTVRSWCSLKNPQITNSRFLKAVNCLEYKCLDNTKSVDENVTDVKDFVSEHTRKLLPKRRVTVIVDSDGMFDHPTYLRSLANSFEQIETEDGQIDLVVGAHMSPSCLRLSLVQVPLDKSGSRFQIIAPNDDTPLVKQPVVNYDTVNARDLFGPALDWLVLRLINAEGNGECCPSNSPTTSWGVGGPIVQRMKISVVYNEVDGNWYASMPGDQLKNVSGPFPLVAAMRCYVVSEMGEIVPIPTELL